MFDNLAKPSSCRLVQSEKETLQHSSAQKLMELLIMYT